MEEKAQQKNIMLTEPLNIIVIGMAGSGKTTFMGKLYQHLLECTTEQPYCLNLDPAVHFLPYTVSDDIRDAVKYKDVMKKYSLGPNGAIMTSLNLFATQFETSLQKIEACHEYQKLFLVDTPGQIEAFTWSASGQIFTSTLAGLSPTVIQYDNVLGYSFCD